VKDLETTESYPGELKDYMTVLIDDKLYSVTTPEAFAGEVSTPVAAITRGMDFEKDAILFFSELRSHMPGHSKDAIQKLIDEEKQHLIYLSQLKTKYE
jgi:rubrerythrin